MYLYTDTLIFLYHLMFFIFLFGHVLRARCRNSNIKKRMSHQFLPLRVTTVACLIHLSALLFLCSYDCKYEKHGSPSSCRLAAVVARVKSPRNGARGTVSASQP